MDTKKNIIIITGGEFCSPELVLPPKTNHNNITPGNGGIGFETAAQLITEQSNHVIIGSRSAEKGEAALRDLQSRGHPGSVEMLELDVKSYDIIASAARTVERKYGRYVTLLIPY